MITYICAAVLIAGQETDLFTVQVVHNGFFCGLRDYLEYISESYDHFDNCIGDTWSLSRINEILRRLGCERDCRLQVYWLLPGKDLRDGLVLIEKQSDIRAMIQASKTEKQLVLFIDHTNFIQGLRGDVYERARIGQRNASITPTVVASASVVASARAEASSSSSVQIPENDIMQIEDSDDSDSEDFEFIDSDFDAAEGDDDLFADNIDKSVNDHNEREINLDHEDEDALEDDDLNIEDTYKKVAKENDSIQSRS
jgi:hypothetical protein